MTAIAISGTPEWRAAVTAGIKSWRHRRRPQHPPRPTLHTVTSSSSPQRKARTLGIFFAELGRTLV